MAQPRSLGKGMPSKATMAQQELQWRAEQMVRDGMQKTPQFKAAVKIAMHHIKKGEVAAKAAIVKPKQAFKPARR